MTAFVDIANDANTFAAHGHAHPSRAFERDSMSSSSFPPHAHEQHQQPAGGQSRVDEDDLLDLLGSDSFSLESRRDRELLALSSFLKTALPGASAGGPAAHPPGPTLAIGGNAAQGLPGGASSSGWNGWRPAHQGGGIGGEGVAAPYGSPMSFASTASSMSNLAHHAAPVSSFSPPPVPSSSSSSSFAFPSASPAHHSFFPPGSPATTSTSILSASPASRTQASPFSAPLRHPQQRRPSASSPLVQTQTPQTLQHIHQGIRAPACSRERVPTLSSIAPTNGRAVAGGAGGASVLDEEGWKARLRSAARTRKTQALEESSDDVMME
ncbi:hypothetical protein JCM10295v2_001413 [Rhodotorula toruloides]